MTPERSSATPPGPARRRPRWAALAAIPVGVVVVVLIVVLAVSKQAGDSADSNLVGKAAPGLTGKLLDSASGKVTSTSFDLPAQPGKWVVVNFFASWCVPCRDEAPELKKWAEAHEAAGDGELVQIVYQESPSDSARFFRDNGGSSWPVVVGDTGNLSLDWGVAKVPETFLVDPSGRIVLKVIAPVTQAWLDRQIAEFQQAAG